MSSLTTLTGRNGKVQVEEALLARTKKWDVSTTLASKSEWGDSDSAGFTNRAAGRKDGTFDLEGAHDTVHEQFDILAPEDIVKTVLWMNNSDLYWHFPRALIMDFKLSVNIDTEEVIGWTSNAGADGRFYRPGQGADPNDPSDSGAPAETLPS